MNAPSYPNVSLAEAQRRVLNVGEYDRQLNALELTPNGDDYNNIMEMMNGADFRPPHTKGR